MARFKVMQDAQGGHVFIDPDTIKWAKPSVEAGCYALTCVVGNVAYTLTVKATVHEMGVLLGNWV